MLSSVWYNLLEPAVYLFHQGDKENHIASIHPVKMLYIWPYFMFFSFPLLYPYLIHRLVPRGALPRIFRTEARLPQLPRLYLQLVTIIFMLVVVHFNTTVHPFTLADNRHYVFYVFRLLLRHPLIKYAVVPIYYYCAWAAIAAFGGDSVGQETPRFQVSDPRQIQRIPRYELPPRAKIYKSEGSHISFVLIWLLATTLSLITAPLVEPRYFIIPWLVWRLHVHSPYMKPTTDQAGKDRDIKVGGFFSSFDGAIRSFINPTYEHRLWFETAWFLFINWATAYIFLYWGFEWSQEPGKVQRFMW